jgi:E3 ubiquitin-protein ligase UHRF1
VLRGRVFRNSSVVNSLADMSVVTDYEKERLERIARNKALLASLDIPAAKRSWSRLDSVAKPEHSVNKRRRQQPLSDIWNQDPGGESLVGRRVSARLQNKVRLIWNVINQKTAKNYSEFDDQTRKQISEPDCADLDSSSEDDFYEDKEASKSQTFQGTKDGTRRRIVSGRNIAHIDKSFDRPNPKTFGAIPCVVNGKWWATRMECSRDGCHAPTVAGISGNETEGCWSIALSGGYEDDVDDGYCFTYTGSGGRDLKGTKAKPKNLRTAPQSSDQTLTGLNLALKVSCETQRPVRVIRGFKGSSKWAPLEGYRSPFLTLQKSNYQIRWTL